MRRKGKAKKYITKNAKGKKEKEKEKERERK
jgi:hypothetical protein